MSDEYVDTGPAALREAYQKGKEGVSPTMFGAIGALCMAIAFASGLACGWFSWGRASAPDAPNGTWLTNVTVFPAVACPPERPDPERARLARIRACERCDSVFNAPKEWNSRVYRFAIDHASERELANCPPCVAQLAREDEAAAWARANCERVEGMRWGTNFSDSISQ